MIPGIVASGQNFPLSLNPALWLDAADTTTITASSGSVSQWNDKSGNSRNFTQGTAGAQPTTGTRTQNSLNVLDFDGNDALVGPTTPNLDAAPVELFVACDMDNEGTWFSQTNTATITSRQFQMFVSAGLTGGIVRGSLTNLNRLPLTSRFRIVGINWISSGSVLRDGNTTAALNVGSATESNVPWRVGARGSGVSFPLNGSVGEVLLFLHELTTTERTNVINYLADKWSITL
jgi:hypothetical protein